MAGRSVSVFLRANVAGYVAGMRRAAGETRRLTREIDESTGRQRRAFDRLGQTSSVVAVGLVAGFVVSAKASKDFNKQMSAVQASAGATAGELDRMRRAALEAGRQTAYSATQAARAEEELVKAGVSAKDVIGGGLKGALDLAAAGQIEVGEAAEVAATAMTQFKLSGKDVPHIADLLSAGANKAQGTVHQLGFALRMGGLVASQFGLSVEDTTGTLAAFASAGLIGSDAGTSLKTMLLHLAAPSTKAADLMRDLGIQTYDTQGQFVGVTALAGQLQKQLGGLTQAQRDSALATIFGTDAIRGANVLMKQGAGGMQEWINKVNDSGNAARTASTKLNNLSGDLTRLKGALTTALIGAGDGAQAPLRGLVQSITGVINAFNALPPTAQSATIWIAGISGATLLAARGLIFMVSTARDARIALQALGLTSARVAAMQARLRGAMAASAAFMAGPWGLAIAAGVGVLAIWASGKKDATKATEEFTQAIESDSGALGTNTRAAVANALEKEGLLRSARRLGVDLRLVTDAVLGNREALAKINAQIDQTYQRLNAKRDGGIVAEHNFEKFRNEMDSFNAGLAKQTGQLNASAAAAKRKADATKATGAADRETASAAQRHAQAQADLTAAMTTATKSADDLQRALDELAKANMDADEATIRQARAAEASAKANDHRRRVSLDEKQALLDLADADHQQLVKMKEAGATAEQLAGKQATLAQQFIRTAMNMGHNRGEAVALAKRYGLLTSATDLTKIALGGYITRVQAAADASKAAAGKTGGAAAAQQAYTGRIRDSLPVLYALAGRSAAARAQVDQLARASGNAAGAQQVSRAAFLKAADAMGIARGRANLLWRELAKLKPKKVPVDVYAQGHWTASGEHRRFPGLAEGGPVPALAPGATRARDSQPAILRVDEHVWTPEEVDAVGGHAAMYRMRAMARAGMLRGYASGGPVSMVGGGRPSAEVVADVMAPIQAGYADMIGSIAQTFAEEWKKFAASGGPVVAEARKWIGTPYSWGGGGKGGPSYGTEQGANIFGFDCSGLTERAYWAGRGISIGGTTYDQHPRSVPTERRPGALGFNASLGHVVIASNKPGYVIEAPYTGSHVREVPKNMPDWRIPKGASFAAGGEVKALAMDAIAGRPSAVDAQLARILQLAGSGPRGGERHDAQIAQGGPIRIWNEQETGGEAYIPLAPSKRARSLRVLGAVARRFGAGVRMADGGIVSFADGGLDSADLNLSDILSRWQQTMNPATKGDVVAAARARRTQLDQLRNAEAALRKARSSKDADRIAAAERRVRKEREDLAAATEKLRNVEARYNLGRKPAAAQLGAALGASIKNTGAFIRNITKLADRGFGTLARHLLEMGGPEAEKIAASAVKMSDKSLRGLTRQINTAQQQQDTLAALPNILTAKGALRSGNVRTWMDLIKAANLPPEDLAAALRLMKTDLFKTKYGKQIWAQMIAHGYAGGGWITGPAGTDRVPLWGTSGEFVVNASSAARNRTLVEAINADRAGALTHNLIPYSGGAGARSVGGDGAAAPLIGELHVNHIPGYSTPQDINRALRHVELTARHHRRS